MPDVRQHPARRQAWEILGALAMVERRWADARDALELLAGDPAATPPERCGYLLAAGDIARHALHDAEAAGRFYGRARALNGSDPRLAGRPSGDVDVPTPAPRRPSRPTGDSR